ALEQKDAANNALRDERDHFKAAYEEAETERSHLKVAYEEAEAERQRLDAVLQQLLRRQSAPTSERLDPEQFQLALENVEQDLASAAAAAEEAAAGNAEDARRRRAPARRNLGHLPEHLPHDEIRIEPTDTNCPCCGGAMHEIAVETTKRLHITPMKLRVRAIVRPKYGCRTCAEAVVQAPAPDSIIPGGLPTEALLAHIAVAKYQDGQPLYRQCAIFARDGVTLDRQTMADWLGRVAWWLSPVWERLVADALRSPKLFVDDTYLPVLDKRAAAAKGKGKKATRTGYLWGLGRDDAPWQGERPPAVAYIYTEDRVYARAAEVLAGYSGILQVDGWGGFKRLIGQDEASTADVGAVTLAYCWAHGRRDVFDIHQATGSPIAGEVLRRIAVLYRIEDAIRGQPPDERRRVRQEQSRRVVDALKVYVEEQLGRVSGKMPVAKALRYLLNHWDGLGVFLDDGRVEIDNNSIERRHRVVATVRRNSLFAGSDAGARSWAIFTSLIQTARLNDVDPVAWLTDVLERMASGAVKANQIDRLLPWTWKADHAATAA
ncbi:IS66 family transposase, partial [Azospirillum sp. sgz302134]